MEFDYLQLVVYISGILAIVISGVIIFLAYQMRELAKTGAEALKEKSPILYDIFLKIVKAGVFDAELKWLQSEIEDKEAYAVSVIERELDKYGLLKYFDVNEIVRQIKITVHAEFNKDNPKKNQK